MVQRRQRLWGGGHAPEQDTAPLPPLFSDDPLLTGYWLSKTGVVDRWPGDVASCADAALAGFVAVLPEFDDNALLEQQLRKLRDLVVAREVGSLRIVSRDGFRATIKRGQAWRFWRRRARILE